MNEPPLVRVYYCHLCLRDITDPVDIDAHLKGTRHKLLKRKTDPQQSNDECAVVVTGFPKKTKAGELKDFFSLHGDVKSTIIKKKDAIVRFENKNSFRNVLSKRIYFKGKILNIRQKTTADDNSVPRQNQPKRQSEIDHEAILNAIKLKNTFDDQMTAFLDGIQLPHDEVGQKYGMLCSHLEMVLGNMFEGCKPLPFGSTVTGLSFRDSDVDVYAYVPDPQYYTNNGDESSAADFVRKSSKLLYRYQNLFTNIVGIPRAKTPIVKCMHKPTGVYCDFNFKNLLGVCNSNLIRFLLSLDARLRPLTMVIKYWAKVHELSGPGKLTNYALVTLIVFYLQQPPNPILPAISALQADRLYENMQERWNGGFDNDPRNLPSISNDATVPELLAGFFKFYTTFEFPMKVVCPATGTAIDRTDFTDVERLPEIFGLYKKYMREGSMQPLRLDTMMCVQDCFEQCHNLTACTSIGAVNMFHGFCEHASSVCDEVLVDRKYETLLPRLFGTAPKMATDPKNTAIAVGLPVVIDLNAGSFIYVLGSNEPENTPDRERSLRTKWYERIYKIVMLVLTKVLHFDVKTEKMAVAEDNNDFEPTTIVCSGVWYLWSGRRKVKVDNTGNCIDVEIKRSEAIINSFSESVRNKTEKTTEFTLNFYGKQYPTRVTLELHCSDAKYLSNFGSFVYFLKLKLPIWIERCQRENIRV